MGKSYLMPIAAPRAVGWRANPVLFAGDENALYGAPSVFGQKVIDPAPRGHRHARSLMHRPIGGATSWPPAAGCLTGNKKTYASRRRTLSFVYYLSMEFLIGRFASRTCDNLLLDTAGAAPPHRDDIHLVGLLETGARIGLRKRGAGLSGRPSQACFLDSMATLAASGDGLTGPRTVTEKCQFTFFKNNPGSGKIAEPIADISAAIDLPLAELIQGGSRARRGPATGTTPLKRFLRNWEIGGLCLQCLRAAAGLKCLKPSCRGDS